jgi:pimeloyl-ACP methyl ester carboxylesterase
MQFKIEGKGEPLVLVPGGLTGCVSWEPHAKRLATTRSVVRVQLLNVEYGLKDRPLPADYSFKTESGALKATLDEAIPSGPVDLAAWSFGAAVALTFALDNPDRVRTLTLIEPPAFWVLDRPPQDPGFEQLKSSSEETRDEVDGEKLEEFVRLVGISPPNVDPRQMPQWSTFMRYRRSLRGNIAPFVTRDDSRRLDEFEPPVLLVKGTGSAPFLHAVIDALGRHLPNSETVEYPAGHAPHIVSMDLFLDKMASFQASRGRIEVTAGASAGR